MTVLRNYELMDIEVDDDDMLDGGEMKTKIIDLNSLEKVTGGNTCRYKRITVERGMTLDSLARQYNTTVDYIRRLNELIVETDIYKRTTLLVPIRHKK